MSLVIDDAGSRAIGLAEYVERLRAFDLDDESALAESAPLLQGLVRDRTMLVEHLTRALEDLPRFAAHNLDYNAQSVSLAVTPRFRVRANVWPARGAYPMAPEGQGNFFAYGLAHNHNFDLLTAGYLGPGYETDVYALDPSTVQGIEGERVALRRLQTVRLSQGTTLLLRKERHVHVQRPPQSLSISINLIPTPRSGRGEQYLMDLATRRIARVLPPAHAELTLMRLAGFVGTARTLDVLEGLARRNLDPLVDRAIGRAKGSIYARLSSA